MSTSPASVLLRTVAVRALAGRLPALVGDALLCAYVVWIWIDPLRFGMGTVRGVGALFLFEFLALLCGAFVWGVREEPRSRWSVLFAVPFVLAVGSAVEAPGLMILFLWRLAMVAASARRGAPDEITELRLRHLGAWGLWFLAGMVTALQPLLGWAELPPGLGWESATPQSDFRVAAPWLAAYFGMRTVVSACDARGGLSRRLTRRGSDRSWAESPATFSRSSGQ